MIPLALTILALNLAPASADTAAAPTAGASTDQSTMGAWNGEATKLAKSSALANSAMAYIQSVITKIKDPQLKTETQDAVFNTETCIKSRANLTHEKKQAIVDKLVAEGLIDTSEAERIPGGLIAGVFPGVRDDGTACPKLPMPYIASPGSVFGGHHSEPGGLSMHVAVNLTSALALAETYRRVFGNLDGNTMPVVRGDDAGKPDADLAINEDIVIAAPIWHDWAKQMVFQWNADGSEYTELNFGGNGKTDTWGAPGNSKTGGHHILGVAEAMARGLPADDIIAQASAHSAPNAGAEFNVVNWLRAAAIIAGVDPVERGYLTKDATGRLRLAAVRKLGSINIQASQPNQPNMLYEYVLHNLSDADYTFTGTASVQSELFIRILAPKFGYDAAKAAEFNTQFRNPILSNLSGERLLILYGNGGIDRVEAEIAKLKSAGKIK
jgi:hypothetical protein